MTREQLLEGMGNPDGRRRRAAIEALRGRLPEVRDDVLALMHDPEWQVRASAAAVLDHAEQDVDVQGRLLAATDDPDARVRRSAYHSLACGHCKPDGCVPEEGGARLVHGMLHDPSIKVRRKLAGEMMWGQQGRGELVTEAFREILLTDTDRTLRERAATFLASSELPRTSMPHREWIGTWTRHVQELLDSTSPTAGVLPVGRPVPPV